MSCNEATRSRTDSSLRRSGSALVLTLLAIACVTSNALPQSARRTAHHKPPRAASKQPAGEVKSLERIALLAATVAALGQTFYAPLVFKANSSIHEEVAAELNKTTAPKVPVMTAQEFASNAEYQPLNLGAGIGQLRILERLTPDTVIDRNQ